MAASTRESEAAPPAGLYDGMVENLVTQFSSSLDCFRELVQNSIDAGTPRVDVWTEFLAGDGHEGTIAIHVDDFGEGMDEAIIDDQFTQLFASTKDDDLTKIGKFGIGFVSVFALAPRGVLVHTGRNGQYWEVFFHEDRSFSKTRVDNPVEGTQITIFLAGEFHRYQELATQIPETLRHWCSQSEVEITFEDRSANDDFSPPDTINEPFEVDGQCPQLVRHEGTEIALAYSEAPRYGFYNRGLTLALTDVGDDILGRWKKRFEFVSFRIKSRYLEHTLSRDSVIRDGHYETAMDLLEEAANGPLLSALVGELEELAKQERWEVSQYHRYSQLMAFLATEPVDEVIRHRERAIFRCFDGQVLSLDEAWTQLRKEGRLLVDRESSALSDLLARQDMPVVCGGETRDLEPLGVYHGGQRLPAAQVLIAVFGRLAASTARGLLWRAVSQVGAWFRRDTKDLDQQLAAALARPDSVYFSIALDEADSLDEEVRAEVDRLLKDAQALMKGADLGVRRLGSGTIAGAREEAPLYVVAKKLGPLMARPTEVLTESRGRFEAAVNRNHPHFARILATYRKHPRMGAFLLARSLSLSQDHELGSHEPMMAAALKEKRHRFGHR